MKNKKSRPLLGWVAIALALLVIAIVIAIVIKAVFDYTAAKKNVAAATDSIEAQINQPFLGFAIESNNQALIKEVVAGLLHYTYISEVSVLDKNRKVLLNRVNPLYINKPLREDKREISITHDTQFVSADKMILSATESSTSSEVSGYIILRTTNQSNIAEIAQIAAISAAIILAIILIIFLLFYYLSRGLNRPLKALAEYAVQLASGQVVTPPAGNYRVTELSSLFMALKAIDSLQAGQKERVNRIEAENLKRQHILQASAMELRAPIGQIRQQLHVIQSHVHNDAKARAIGSVDTCASDIDVLDRHVLAIAAMAELDSGLLSVNNRWIDIQGFVTGLTTAFEKNCTSRNIDWVLEITGNPDIEIFIDHDIATFIIANALGNAIKYTDTGQVKLKIGVRDNSLNALITDSGNGLPENIKTQITEKKGMETWSINKPCGGMGLGIPAMYKFSQFLDGNVDVQSMPDTATRVEISIPVKTNKSETGNSNGRESTRSRTANITPINKMAPYVVQQTIPPRSASKRHVLVISKKQPARALRSLINAASQDLNINSTSTFYSFSDTLNVMQSLETDSKRACFDIVVLYIDEPSEIAMATSILQHLASTPCAEALAVVVSREYIGKPLSDLSDLVYDDELSLKDARFLLKKTLLKAV